MRRGQEKSVHSLILDTATIPYTVTYSSKTRKLKIFAELEKGIVVVLPDRAKIEDGVRFVKQQSDWVLRQWLKLQKQRKKFGDTLQPLLEKNKIFYLGKEYQLVIDVGTRHWPPVTVEDDVIVIQCVHADLAQSILERWYRQQARAVIAGALELYRQRMQVNYTGLSIKDQKTRWGSCSSKGNLNFSWRLILAPKFVLDYVVVHELAHLREMNHSSRFWALVEKFFPDYSKSERWLKENSVSLRI